MASARRFFKKTTPKEQSVGKTAEKVREKASSSIKTKQKKVKKTIHEVKKEPAVVVFEEKNIAKTAPIIQLPNIPRIISENITGIRFQRPHILLNRKKLLLLSGFLIIVGVGMWEGVGLVHQMQLFMGVMEKRSSLEKELTLWESIAQKYPTYRDAYYQTAVLAYRLGEREKEQEYLKKVLALDPNYQPAQNLQKMSQ